MREERTVVGMFARIPVRALRCAWRCNARWAAENRTAWQSWNAALREGYGIRTSGGALVTSTGVIDYMGDVRGASMVEFESLEAAIAVAKRVS